MNNFDAEMSRFENEISNVNTLNGPPRMPLLPPPPGMFPPMLTGIPPLPPPPPPPSVMAQLMNNNSNGGGPPPQQTRLPPRPAFVPHQLRHRVPQQSVPYRAPHMSQRIPSPPPPPPSSVQNPISQPQQQSTLSAQPLLYKNQTTNDKPVPTNEPMVPTLQRPPQMPTIENQFHSQILDKTSSTASAIAKPEPFPHPVSKAYVASTKANDHDGEGSSTEKKKSKNKQPEKNRHIRMAGGTTWKDETLGEWDPDDFRLFCGDLGNEVNDDVLTRAFNKYSSFQKAKVVRDKRSGKSRGYGFVSFKDSQDYIRAMREMNGKYVGNRPIKLRKSNWQERNIDVVKKKMDEKRKMGLR